MPRRLDAQARSPRGDRARRRGARLALGALLLLLAAPAQAAPEEGEEAEAEAIEEQAEAPEQILAELLKELESVASTLTTTVTLEPLEFQDTATVAPELPPPAEPERPAPKERVLNLVFSGAGAGLGGERFVFSLQEKIAAALEGEELISAHVFHGVLTQGSSILLSPDGRISTVLSFLDGTPVFCEDPRPARILSEGGERLIDPGEEAAELAQRLLAKDHHLRASELSVRRCQNASRVPVLLYAPAGKRLAELSWGLEHFEFGRGLRLTLERGGKRTELDLIGFPRNDAARRFRLLDLARRSSEPTLVVDAGSFVDGTSRGRGRLSMLRPLAFEMMSRLKPAALVPGDSELVDGARQLLREAKVARLEYIATNWVTEVPELVLPKSRIKEITTRGGSVRVAFLGVLDPALAGRIPKLASEGVELADPIEAVEAEAERLLRGPRRPDAIFVLTTAGPSVLEALRENLRGVDAIIGGGSMADARVERSMIDLLPQSDAARAPAYVPFSGVGRAQLRFTPRGQPSRLLGINTVYARARPSVEPDPRVLGVLARSRHALYPALEEPIIGGWPDQPLKALSEEQWRTIVCHAVRAHTDADVVLLPALPPAEPLPGPLTELVVSERLSVLDHLEATRIDGEDLADLLRAPPEYVPTICGGDEDKVGGRPISKSQSYRLVTTDRALLLGLGARLLAYADGDLLASSGAAEPIIVDEAPLGLREAVLESLRSQRRGAPAPVHALLEAYPVMPAAWLLLIDGVSLRLERFQGAAASAFSTVPDTLVTAPSSLSVGASADARLSYDDPVLLLELRTRLRYQRLAIGDRPAEETDDALRFALAASLPGVDFATGSLAWMPYGELALDTEFTAGSGAEGETPTDRRAEVSAALGLSLKNGPLDRLRLGGFALRDFSRPTRPTKFGARLDAELSARPGPTRLSARVESSLFGPSASEDRTDLRFRALFEGKIGVRVARHLLVSLLVQGLAFSGAVLETRDPALSLRLGVAIDLTGAFRL